MLATFGTIQTRPTYGNHLTVQNLNCVISLVQTQSSEERGRRSTGQAGTVNEQSNGSVTTTELQYVVQACGEWTEIQWARPMYSTKQNLTQLLGRPTEEGRNKKHNTTRKTVAKLCE